MSDKNVPTFTLYGLWFYEIRLKFAVDCMYIETLLRIRFWRKKTLFWVSEEWFEIFFRHGCHTNNFDFFFWLTFFLRLLMCIFFASQHFSNLRSVNGFLWKRLLLNFGICFYWDQTFLRPKFDVRHPTL